MPAYVLITPARNEEQFIELTIQSVVAQSIHPIRWVIVSDGSTDRTDEIVKQYASKYPWIELVRMPERRERHFAGKVHAFNAGYARVKDMPYEFIGSLDADMSFDSEYFSFLLGKFADDANLGLAGTPFSGTSDGPYDYRYANIEHVSGACQFFRRGCFEAVGGYVPIKAGGVDHFVVVTARMKGWKTRTFTEKLSFHHREMGTAMDGPWMARFRGGEKDYAFGNHPLWELFRMVYQLTKPPRFIGGVLLFAGYAWAQIRRAERPVSGELVAFVRREQMDRLRVQVTSRVPFRKSAVAAS